MENCIMNVIEILPSVSTLSHADKFRLVQIVLQQLAQEDGVPQVVEQNSDGAFDPRLYFGVASHPRKEIDDYLAEVRNGWDS